MRLPVSAALLSLAIAGCAPRVGKFDDQYFAHEYHTYRIAYTGAGVDRMMGPDWEPVNWVPKDGTSRWSHKTGGEYATTRTFDFDADGNQDYFRVEAIRDFDFKHRKHDARLWLQVLPVAADAKATDLSALAEAYVGGQLPKDIAGGSLSGDTDACEVSGMSAMRVDFDAGDRRGRLVVIDPGQPEKVGPNNLDARIFYYAVYVAKADEFAASEGDLDSLLDRLSVGTTKKTIPEKPAPTTCRAPAAAPVETEAPEVDAPSEDEPAESESAPDSTDESAEEDEGEDVVEGEVLTPPT